MKTIAEMALTKKNASTKIAVLENLHVKITDASRIAKFVMESMIVRIILPRTKLRQHAGIGKSNERFVRKRTLVKYQSQSEVIKLML